MSEDRARDARRTSSEATHPSSRELKAVHMHMRVVGADPRGNGKLNDGNEYRSFRKRHLHVKYTNRYGNDELAIIASTSLFRARVIHIFSPRPIQYFPPAAAAAAAARAAAAAAAAAPAAAPPEGRARTCTVAPDRGVPVPTPGTYPGKLEGGGEVKTAPPPPPPPVAVEF